MNSRSLCCIFPATFFLFLVVQLNPAMAAPQDSAPTVTTESWGTTTDGHPVQRFVVTNRNGLRMVMTDYGATLLELHVPDRNGELGNIVIGSDSIESLQANTAYFGCTVGRYCNRIALGKFSIGGKEYTLATNNGPNHLHGGTKGWDKSVWQVEVTSGTDFAGLKFRHKSADGDEGYPGNVEATAVYTLDNKNRLSIRFSATSDQTTPVNMTNHAYWNLSGKGTIESHELRLAGTQMLEFDDQAIPTGKLIATSGTPFDFSGWRRIGERLAETGIDPKGYDHCFVLPHNPGELGLAGEIRDPASGRLMRILTTQPSLQVYSGNYLDGSATTAGAPQHGAMCLETQHYPDSPNHDNFPTTLLKPGETYNELTIHEFGTFDENGE